MRFWSVALGCALLLRLGLQERPDWVEYGYSRGFFVGLRAVFDYGVGWMPSPVVYLLVAGLLAALARFFRRLYATPHRRWQRLAAGIVAVGCAVPTLFLMLWGFNYLRLPVETQLGIAPAALDRPSMKAEWARQTAVLLRAREAVQPDTAAPVPANALTADVEKNVFATVQHGYRQLGLPTPGRPRGRQPFWNGFLMRFGAAGIYNPFTGEANIDRGLHFLTKPYNLAHEYGHAYGWGDEGACTFLGYLALRRSDDPLLRYSAELGYWREVAAAYRSADPADFRAVRATLPSGLLADLEAIYRTHDQYPEFFEAFRKVAYHNYLKAQGIAEGMANYGKVVPLVVAWERKKSLGN